MHFYKPLNVIKSSIVFEVCWLVFLKSLKAAFRDLDVTSIKGNLYSAALLGADRWSQPWGTPLLREAHGGAKRAKHRAKRSPECADPNVVRGTP